MMFYVHIWLLGHANYCTYGSAKRVVKYKKEPQQSSGIVLEEIFGGYYVQLVALKEVDRYNRNRNMWMGGLVFNRMGIRCRRQQRVWLVVSVVRVVGFGAWMIGRTCRSSAAIMAHIKEKNPHSIM